MKTHGVAEAALLGMAAGMRAMSPLAALSLTLPGGRRVKAPLVAASAAELVYDKLPQASDRTEPMMLGVRIGVGALAGGFAARILGTSFALGAATGGVAALASTFLFHRLRAAAARRVPPLAAGIGEDLLAAGAATAALRRLANAS